MGNDNQKPVTNNNQPQTGSLPPVPTDDMPPVVMEDTTPPMLSINDLPLANTQTAPDTTPVVELPKTDSGSAAPSDDVVMAPVITTQKKKFAGGRVIATILGLFLLVGGLGAGIMLVGQDQNIQEKAGDCVQDCINGGGGTLVCGCECGETNSRCPAGDGDTDPNTNGTNPGGGGNTQSTCESGGGYWCDEVVDINGNNVPGFCNSGNQTCGNVAADLGYTINIGVGMPGAYTGGWICRIGVNGYTGGPCVQSNSVPGSSGYSSVPNCFCGTIQIDGGPNDGTYTSSCGCGNDDDTPPGDNPTPTPPTTVITASCQNLKAYPTTGSTTVPLTNAQLSALDSGDQFNLCVKGIKSGGSFDKVRFTINGVSQPEQAMVDNIGSTTEGQFCTLYTIPAVLPANRTFSFEAEMHHVTLGWK